MEKKLRANHLEPPLGMLNNFPRLFFLRFFSFFFFFSSLPLSRANNEFMMRLTVSAGIFFNLLLFLRQPVLISESHARIWRRQPTNQPFLFFFEPHVATAVNGKNACLRLSFIHNIGEPPPAAASFLIIKRWPRQSNRAVSDPHYMYACIYGPRELIMCSVGYVYE
jgi:hypothetical protein